MNINKAQSEDFISAKETAEILNVKYEDLLHSIKSGFLYGTLAPKPHKLGRRYFYTREQVFAFIKNGLEPNSGNRKNLKKSPITKKSKEFDYLRKAGCEIKEKLCGQSPHDGYSFVKVYNFNRDEDWICYNPITNKAQFLELSRLLPFMEFNNSREMLSYYKNQQLGEPKPNVYDKSSLCKKLEALGMSFDDVEMEVFYSLDKFKEYESILDELFCDSNENAQIKFPEPAIPEARNSIKREDALAQTVFEQPSALNTYSPEMILDKYDYSKAATYEVNFPGAWITNRVIMGVKSAKNSTYVDVYLMLKNGYGYVFEYRKELSGGDLSAPYVFSATLSEYMNWASMQINGQEVNSSFDTETQESQN